MPFDLNERRWSERRPTRTVPVPAQGEGVIRVAAPYALIALLVTAALASSAGAMTLTTYRTVMHNQHDWTNRALENRCRDRVTLDEFTKTPLASVLPAWRDDHVFYAKRKHERAQASSSRCFTDPVAVIRYVFGPYGDQAVAVARCETGGTFNVYAQNGQYWGLFQMGEYARSVYGHSWTALGQSRSAYAYFVDSGRDWSPWQCRPWGLAW